VWRAFTEVRPGLPPGEVCMVGLEVTELRASNVLQGRDYIPSIRFS
jgi:hypothetical protein